MMVSDLLSLGELLTKHRIELQGGGESREEYSVNRLFHDRPRSA
jgi:hypothetical protein